VAVHGRSRRLVSARYFYDIPWQGSSARTEPRPTVRSLALPRGASRTPSPHFAVPAFTLTISLSVRRLAVLGLNLHLKVQLIDGGVHVQRVACFDVPSQQFFSERVFKE